MIAKLNGEMMKTRSKRRDRRWLRTCYLSAVSLVLCVAANQALAGESLEVSLAEAVKIALSSNYDLKQTANQVDLRRVSVRQARAAFLPDLRLVSAATRTFDKTSGSPGIKYVNRDTEALTGRLSLDLELFRGFSRHASLQESGHELQASESILSRTRQTTIFQTATYFIEATKDLEKISVNRENLEAQQLQLDLVKAFHEAGKRPVADLYHQQAEVAGAELQLLRSERDYNMSNLQLEEMLGLTPTGDIAIEPLDVGGLAESAPQFDEVVAIEEALSLRPDVLAQASRIQAAEKQVKAAQGGYWPTMSLFADYGSSYSSGLDDHYDFGDQFLDNNRYTTVGLSLSIPIFDRLTTRSSEQRAKVELKNQELEMRELTSRIRSEVLEALEDYRLVRKGVDVAEAQVKYARESLMGYEERYGAGASTLAEVTQARATYLESRYSELEARYGLLLDVIAVAFYTGDQNEMAFLIEEASESRPRMDRR